MSLDTLTIVKISDDPGIVQTIGAISKVGIPVNATILFFSHVDKCEVH